MANSRKKVMPVMQAPVARAKPGTARQTDRLLQEKADNQDSL